MIEQIQQSVIFNTQYNQMKDSNKKFEGFAHDLIAESLKEWAQESQFVQDKLDQRLKIDNQDELDKLIAKAYFKDKQEKKGDGDAPEREPSLREKVENTGIKKK